MRNTQTPMSAKEGHSRPARLVAWLMMVLFTFGGIQLPANAAIVATDTLVAETELEAQRDTLSQTLMRDDVKQQMLSLGVDPADVQNRINSLTAAELAQIQGKLDQLPAGGDALGAVVLVLLILILLDVTGLTDIFPRI